MEIQEQDSQQHQHRAKQGVEEELDGRVQLARAAPDANQQIHRYQHGLPEDEEQEHVVGHEDAEHARLQYQEPNVVFLHAVLDGIPRRQDRDGPQQRGQHDEQERDAVYADHVAGANGRDPIVGCALDELEAGTIFQRPEPWNQRQRNRKAQEAEDVADPADGVLVLLRH